jgi:hypothetical protein
MSYFLRNNMRVPHFVESRSSSSKPFKKIFVSRGTSSRHHIMSSKRESSSLGAAASSKKEKKSKRAKVAKEEGDSDVEVVASLAGDTPRTPVKLGDGLFGDAFDAASSVEPPKKRAALTTVAGGFILADHEELKCPIDGASSKDIAYCNNPAIIQLGLMQPAVRATSRFHLHSSLA